MQRGFSGILMLVGVLILAAVAVGAYYFGGRSNQAKILPQPSPRVNIQQPSPPTIDETANWNIYTNPKLGVSFNYPKDWRYKESFLESIDKTGKEQLSELPQRIELSPKDYKEESSVIFITYEENPDNLPLAEFDKKMTGMSGIGPGYSLDNKTVTTPEGITAYYSDKVSCSPTGCHAYIIPYKQKIFTIRSNAKEIISNQKEILDTVFATFKFLDQADETAGWKTYNGSKYLIKYPNNLYLYEFKNDNESVWISDIQNPTDIPEKISPDNHSIFGVSIYEDEMPKSFPYTNGLDKNETIKSFSINGNDGIRGKQTSTLGEGEAVYLKNPKGGFAEITNQLGDSEAFNKLLATFKFN